jgi:HlyD family secretion protein
LETDELQIQLKKAQAALSLAQAELDKLLAGASQEEIKVAQTKVDNKQIALDTAKQNLDDAYEDALNVLEDAYLKAYNAQNSADLIQRTYFTKIDQEGIKIRENRDKIKTAVSQIKSYLDTAKVTKEKEDIDTALSQTEEDFADIAEALKIIRETCETPAYRDAVSSADKSSLDTQRVNVNTVLTDVVDAKQTIISKELAIDTAESEFQKAKDDLSLLIAPVREEDINLHQAQVDQAKSQVNILENQIEKAYLRSPVEGQVIEIKKRVGEMVQPGLQDVVITILPVAPFEIEVDIYEEDIVKIEVGNPVDISLVAFPEKKFLGKVISIDPAEKLIEGVVYYEVSIDFEEIPEGVKPGMTADLIIKTASKEDVLVIPEDAIQKKEGKTIAEVFKDGTIEEREIETGLWGSNDLVEVISGLSEREKVILR